MTRSTNTAATFYKEDEETRRMMGSMGLGLGLGLGLEIGMGIGLEEEAGMVEQVKEDPDSTGETQMMNETQFIFEFPGQEEENTHNTTVGHEPIHSPSSEYLLPVPLSSSLPFHSDSSTLQFGSYNSNSLGGANTPASTSTFHDHTHLSSTSSVIAAAVSASLPPLRPGSPTTEAMRSMMSVFRVDPFASYDIDAGSRRKRRKRGSSYAMLSDPEQTSREEPLMFTFQIDGMQDNEYVNFNHLSSASAILDGSLSIPSSPSMNILSSYSSALPNYNAFLHSETDDLSTMVLHSTGETATTTTGGGSASTAFGNLYPSYTPSSRHHHPFHDINMMSGTMQRHSHPHHNPISSSNPTSNQSSTHNLSNTSYMLQNTQQNACFNLDLGLGMNVNMNAIGLGTSFPGTHTRIPIPGVSPLPAASVPMNIGFSDADVNVGSSMSDNNVPPMDSLSAPITELSSGMIDHHFTEEEGGSNVWPSSHSHPSYSHSSHYHSPSQPRYHRRHHHHQSRHTHTSQSQNPGFDNRFGEEQLRHPLNLNSNKLSGIHGIAQSLPMLEQEHEPENKYQTEQDNQSQIDHTQGRDEHQNGDDNAHGQGIQNQIIEYDLSLGNIQIEDARETNPSLESRTLTEIGQLSYPPSSSENEEDSANDNENEKDGEEHVNGDDQKDGEVACSDHVLKFGPESDRDEERQRLGIKKRKRGNDNLENNFRWYSSRPVSEDVDVQRVHNRDYAIISSPSPPTATVKHLPTYPSDTYRAYTTSGLDFNSFSLPSEFDIGVNNVDEELDRECVDLNDRGCEQHEYFSKHHERNEKVDNASERPTPEISVTSRPDAPSSAWNGPGGISLLPAPSSAAGPEHGHGGRDDKQQNNNESDEGFKFGGRDVGSSNLELELGFNLGPGSGPGMEACNGPHPSLLLLTQGAQQCLNRDGTESDFVSSPPKSSSAVSSDFSAESSSTPPSTHHQIQLPKLHSHNQLQEQLQGSTHDFSHYFDNSDDHVRNTFEHDQDHSVATGQVYSSTSHSPPFFLSPSSLNVVSSESSLSLNAISSPTNMNTNSSSSAVCGSTGSGATKMHICWICHKEFPRPSGLATHMNTHSGLKPYRCPIPACSKTFAVRSNARRHLRIHGTEIGSSIYSNSNEGAGDSLLPYRYTHGRERSSPQDCPKRYLQPRSDEGHSHHSSHAPPHSYLSYQYSVSEDRLPSPSLNYENPTRINESGGSNALDNYYDYYMERSGIEKFEELEDSVPRISGIKQSFSSPTPSGTIAAISPELLFSQRNFISPMPQAISDTRPSSTSSNSSSSDSSMHTPISSTLEDPNISTIPSSVFQPSELLKPHTEIHLSQFNSTSVEMGIGIDTGSPSTPSPTEALISMPIPQGPKFGSSMLLYF